MHTDTPGNSTEELALFPLNTVLFPGGPLPLRIFEPRYVDMVRECLREQRGFGVVLIRAGARSGLQQFEAHRHVGTHRGFSRACRRLARIDDARRATLQSALA